MTIDEFKILEKTQREQLLFHNGVYLASRQEPEFVIDLYQIDSFYIEAFYHQGKKRLIYIRAFSTTDDLLPYIMNIDISFVLV